VHPTGVGRDHAAQSRGAARRVVDSECEAGPLQMSLEALQGLAGAGHDLPRRRVDRLEPGQPAQAEHHLAAPRDAASHQTAVAPLGDHGRAERAARL
jgi:hypothetical protein